MMSLFTTMSRLSFKPKKVLYKLSMLLIIKIFGAKKSKQN